MDSDYPFDIFKLFFQNIEGKIVFAVYFVLGGGQCYLFLTRFLYWITVENPSLSNMIGYYAIFTVFDMKGAKILNLICFSSNIIVHFSKMFILMRYLRVSKDNYLLKFQKRGSNSEISHISKEGIQNIFFLWQRLQLVFQRLSLISSGLLFFFYLYCRKK